MPAGPRIAPVGEPDDAQRAVLEKAPTQADGTVRNIFLTLAHHPFLLKRFNAFAGVFYLSDRFTARERELVILRVAGRIGSRYEYGQHLPMARDAGLSDDEITAALCQPGAPALAAADAQLVDVADEVLATGALRDETWAALRDRYADDAILELLFLVGAYRMVGDVLNIAGVELEDEPDTAVDWAAAAG